MREPFIHARTSLTFATCLFVRLVYYLSPLYRRLPNEFPLHSILLTFSHHISCAI